MTSGASRLNQLMELAREGSPEARRDLLRLITDLFMAPSAQHSPAVMQHFEAILSRLAGDAEPALRRETAERLADAPAAPKGLINLLARDNIAVAEPVLKRSTALSDDDLIAIITLRNQGHINAIARRAEIPSTVSAAIVDHGAEAALISLAKNQGAQFSAAAMQAMVAKARKRTDLQVPMTGRYDLPPQLLTQLYFYVASPLKKEILHRSDMLDPALVDVAVRANRHRLMDEIADEPHETQEFISDAIRMNAVHETLLKRLIAEKRRREFQFAFAHFIGVDLATGQTILNDQSFEALAVACRAVSVERPNFARFVMALRKSGGEEAKALRILDLYEKVPVEAAERIMRFWRMRTEAAAGAARLARFIEDDDEPMVLTDGKR
ncbi:DUF2336 domain-containing protein [Marinicaulis aureus]|uniref:DUF2336 domain-containing protein n=1 Tax=Hyphococcus aureus TaxID=2666033 RepID=A0ABW1KZW1_9PROT